MTVTISSEVGICIAVHCQHQHVLPHVQLVFQFNGSIRVMNKVYVVRVIGPTMKLKRQVVTKMYEKEIEALYADVGGQ